MTATLEAPRQRSVLWRAVFVVLMLALMGLFVSLGIWQVERLGEKEALIARVAERMTAAPEPLPAADQWPTLDAASYDYRPVSVTGHFMPAETVLVFTSLGDARGQASGPGYWVMTPLALNTGGTIFINRGFVPERESERFRDDADTPRGEITLSGIAREGEAVTSFTPGPNLERRIDWTRSIARLAAQVDPSLAPFAPLYIDLPAGPQGSLPQGGETLVAFPNNHLGYAITWFGFAALIPFMLVFWLLQERRRSAG
jgi:surfeit locus 1 family protein